MHTNLRIFSLLSRAPKKKYNINELPKDRRVLKKAKKKKENAADRRKSLGRVVIYCRIGSRRAPSREKVQRAWAVNCRSSTACVFGDVDAAQ